MSRLQTFKQQSRKTRFSVYAGFAIAVYALIGFLLLPYLAMQQLPAKLGEALNGRAVSIERIAINPFALSLTVENFHIAGKSLERFVGFDYLHLNFELVSVFTQVLTFDELTLTNPYGYVQIDKQGQLNFADLIAAEAPAGPELSDADADTNAESSGGIPAVLSKILSVSEASVYFSDLNKQTPFYADIGPLNINLSDFSTERDKDSPYQLKAESGGGVIGSALAWEGFVSINPLASNGKLRIDDVNLSRLASYIQEQFHFDVQDGFLDVSGEYRFDFSADQPSLFIDQADISVANLKIGHKEEDNTLLHFPQINVSTLDFSLADQSMRIASLEIIDADYSVRLNKKGEINLAQLFVSDSGETVAQTQPAEQSKVKAEALKQDAEAQLEPASKPAADPDNLSATSAQPEFQFQLDSLLLRNNTVKIFDLSPQQPMGVDFSERNLELLNFNLVEQNLMPLSLTAKLGKEQQKGDLSVAGDLMLFPSLRASLNLDLKGQPLIHFEPYLSEVAKLRVASGSTDMSATVAAFENLTTDQTELNIGGNFRFNDVSLLDSEQAKPVLAFSRLAVSDLDFSSTKNTLVMQQLLLQSPEMWLGLDAQGQFNLSQLMVADSSSQKPEESVKEPAAEVVESKPMDIALNQLRLQQGNVNFSDRSVDPLFSIALNKTDMNITGLSSKPDETAEMQLSAMINNYAPINMQGAINPLSEQLYADLAVQLKSLNMSSFSSYSGVYVGKEIDKGKLNLDVDYSVKQQKLNAKNSVFIDQFNFGENVASDQATSLPVGLAVSLLKNQNDEITIDLPISGDLADPDFGYGPIVWKAIGNLIIKAASSPFTLLASLVDSDQDLSKIMFASASNQLSEAAIGKLAALESALLQRPELSLDIQACYNREFDEPSFKQQQLQQKLNPSNESLSLKESHKRISKLYQQGFAQSLVLDEQLQDLPKEQRLQAEVEAMQQALLSFETVAEPQLQALARQRAQQIQQQLLQSGQLNAARLFTTAIDQQVVVDNQLPCNLTIQSS